MALRTPGQRVQLYNGNMGTIKRILVDGSLEVDTRYQVLLDKGHQLIAINGMGIRGAQPSSKEEKVFNGSPWGIKGVELKEGLPIRPKDFFAREREFINNNFDNFVKKETSKDKLDRFQKILQEGHGVISQRPNIKVELILEERREPRPNAKIVFMGMKTVTETIVCSIYKYGITPLKFLNLAKEPGFTIKEIAIQTKDKDQAKSMREKFLATLPRDKDLYLDEHKLLLIANAHKSGDTQNSGFHSTSGKPDYASEYADASGQVIGKAYYNFGVAIEISDDCYPVVIQEAVENWNKRHPEKAIKMAFGKDEKTWERDYESEILLGGATPSTDFVYFGVWAVTRTQVGGIVGGIKEGLGNVVLKKTKM